MIVVVAAMAAAVLTGVVLHRHRAAYARRLGRLALDAVLWVVQPFVYLTTLPRARIDAGLAAGLGVGFATLAFVGVLAWLVGARLLRLDRPMLGTLVCSAIIANTGYFGLPFIGTLLGRHALPAAIAWDSMISGPMVYFVGSVAAGWFGRPADGGWARRLLTRNPLLVSAVIGLALPASVVPESLTTAGHDIVWLLLALGFLALGVTLAAEADELDFPRLAPAEVAGLAIRIAVAPAIYLALSSLVDNVPTAFRVDAAMPVGLSLLLLAHSYDLDLRLAATLIAWSSAIVAIWGLVAGAI